MEENSFLTYSKDVLQGKVQEFAFTSGQVYSTTIVHKKNSNQNNQKLAAYAEKCTAGSVCDRKNEKRVFIQFITNPFGTESPKTGGILLYEKNQSVRDKMVSDRDKMQTLWKEMQSCGVELYLDGRHVSPDVAARKTVCENSPYMADYVLGENGKVSQVRFDRVKPR